jgi:hypothetical protein
MHRGILNNTKFDSLDNVVSEFVVKGVSAVVVNVEMVVLVSEAFLSEI